MSKIVILKADGAVTLNRSLDKKDIVIWGNVWDPISIISSVLRVC